ncbi:MAG: hypothetical protein IJT94_02585, partial [Oscillibacter sp.]|nr:hypothetical protein [Oscillibacter sp.]
MDRNHKDNPRGLYLFLAAVISLSIWFFVDNFGNNGSAFSARQKVSEVPIEYTGLSALADRGLMLVTDEETTESIDLVFEGPRLTVVQLDRSVIRVSADLSSITSAGVQTVRYNSPSYLNADGRATWEAQTKFSKVSVFKRTPEYATVNIEELARKELDIRCELVGTVAEGYTAGQPQLSLGVVELQGMEVNVSAVSYAKVILDLGEGAEDSVSAELPIQFYDAENQMVEPEDVSLSVQRVTATLPVYMTKTLPLKVNFTESAGARL